MNDIITNGSEIKQRILSEINNARQCIYLAMAWFTDRDIAAAIIGAKNRNVTVDIILSSNVQNETVKGMLLGASISIHAFDTGDARGVMHHKFCLIDSKISINGSYNYSYNASNNNVENIHVSDEPGTYRQLLSEFERLKYNIDNKIDVNAAFELPEDIQQPMQRNTVEAFYQQLHDLVYSSAQINTDDYKKQGYERSKESGGHIDIFRTGYNNIKEEIRVFATSDGLNDRKSILISNLSNAFESKKAGIQAEKQADLAVAQRGYDLEVRQVTDVITRIKQEKSILESGNLSVGERGLLQVNKEIEKNKLETRSLEQSFIIKKFWRIGTVLSILGMCVFVFYLSVFFASAMYKVFFEGNVIRKSLEAGINPGLPQLVDANAIVKIFTQQGVLFGIMAMLFFLIPILLSNLELIGSQKKWVNKLCFWAGVLIFDIVVSTMVAINTDEIKSLLVGKESQLKIWEVVNHGEFWLIFVFGMIPLIITHFLIVNIETAYKRSQREIVDAERFKRIKALEEEMIELVSEKESLWNKIKEKDNQIGINTDRIQVMETEFNKLCNQIENKYGELLSQITTIFEDFKAKIVSGRIFTDEILDSIISSYQSGFIEFLPEYYAEKEVAARVREIEQAVLVN